MWSSCSKITDSWFLLLLDWLAFGGSGGLVATCIIPHTQFRGICIGNLAQGVVGSQI